MGKEEKVYRRGSWCICKRCTLEEEESVIEDTGTIDKKRYDEIYYSLARFVPRFNEGNGPIPVRPPIHKLVPLFCQVHKGGDYCEFCGEELNDDDYYGAYEDRGEFQGRPCSEYILQGYRCTNCGIHEEF